MFDNEIEELLGRIKIFEKLYEHIRFVDPVLKKVLDYKNDSVNELDIKCFDFWGKNKICDNCISIRAYNENETFIKVEYADDKVYMITAIPFELKERRIVIELLKDTTTSLIFGTDNESKQGKSEIYNIIDSMNNLALRDTLTGLYNRRYINEKLPIDLLSAVLSGKSLSIIMADIDHFKKVNDTYGHLTGDATLRIFAQTISGCIKRESDWVARFGGEEFLICLPGASLDKTIATAELMRNTIEEKEISYDNISFKITSSFGICSIKPQQGESIESLIKQADEKLYEAKKNGRNRVEY